MIIGETRSVFLGLISLATVSWIIFLCTSDLVLEQNSSLNPKETFIYECQLRRRYMSILQSELENRTNRYQDDSLLDTRAAEEQEQINSVQKKRLRYTKKICKKAGIDKPFDPEYVQKTFFYNEDPRILHCSVPKIGSTFWRRILHVLGQEDPKLVSPFMVARSESLRGKFSRSLTNRRNEDKYNNLLDSSLKFVFARDPYHRLFSTYIDKVFAPNGYMWKLSNTAVLRFGPSEDPTDRSDATFAEFVSQVNLKDVADIDKHLRPAAYMCDPCKFHFDVIGKMETFQDDANFILREVGVLGHDIVFQNMSIEAKYDYIVGDVIRAFHRMPKWNKHISVYAGLQRLWRQLHIAGLIDITDSYPLSESESNTVQLSEFLDLALAAHKRATPAAHRQKQQAYLQAYSAVSRRDLETLRRNYLIDFERFDYEQRPAELYGQKTHERIDFDYFDVLRLK